MAEAQELVKETLPIPKDFKELVNKLSIEDLRTFCFTFGLSQDGTKANLKERLLEYYQEKFTVQKETPVPTPRKKSELESPHSKEKHEKGLPVPEAIGDVEKTLEHTISSFADQLRKSDDRIEKIEVSVSKINAYVEESLATFRVSLTEALMESTEKMMGSFKVPDDSASKEDERKGSGSLATSPVERKLNFLTKNANDVCEELKKSINSEAIPSRVERQLKRLNDCEAVCVRAVEELLANNEQEELIQRVVEEWD